MKRMFAYNVPVWLTVAAVVLATDELAEKMIAMAAVVLANVIGYEEGRCRR
jgi:hypothetical protein